METPDTITNLHDLLYYDARRFTSAEVMLRNSLHGWISTAGSLHLKTVLLQYLDLVNMHVEKLELLFEDENISSFSMGNHIMDAYIEAANEKLARCTDAEVKDACLLESIESINHFKISMYATAAAFARELHLEKAAGIYHEAGTDEKQIDIRLSQLAALEVNARATTPFVLSA